MNSIEQLFINQLKDLYSAENQLILALPKMAKAAQSQELQRSFEEHLEQTKDQIRRLEEIFASCEESPRGKKCMVMDGLVGEGEKFIESWPSPDVFDAGLIAVAQKVEHYEIAAYRTAHTYAESLGYEEIVSLLQQTLDEECHTNERWAQLAERSIVVEASE